MSFFLKPLAVILLVAILPVQALAAISRQDENLIYHTNFGEPERVQELVNAGANPNVTTEDKWPLVTLAALRADDKGFAILKILVAAGADLNVRDGNGETPLMSAITTNNEAMVKYMIEHGADFRAVNEAGRSVLAFAEHYGNSGNIFLINEAIRLENKRIRDGRSRRRMYRMLDDYVYYSCAMQYISFNQATGLYRKEEREKKSRLLEQVKAKVINSSMELQYNFHMLTGDLDKVGDDVRQMIFDQLEALISNRNRLKHGVGTDTDLDRRCKGLMELWREAYQQYEDEGRMKD